MDEENPAIHGSESAGDARTIPEVADQGKDVVDADGERIGMLSDVDDETLYVDPDPTLTERVMSRLHWREGDRDEIRLPAERVRRIDDDVVVDVGGDADSRRNP